MSKPNHYEDPLLSEDLFEAIQGHYNGEGAKFWTHYFKALLKARSNRKFASLFDVPSKYKSAYRMMHSVPATALKEIAKGSKIPANGVIMGGTYTPLTTAKLTSWTVNARMFHKPDEPSMLGEHSRGYVVMLEADLSENSAQFMFNPDVMPWYVDVAEDFAYQREVVSTGKVKLKRIMVVSAPAGPSQPIVRQLVRDHKLGPRPKKS